MKKKILLIGLGNIGMAHLKSFQEKKNYKFFIFDKYLHQKEIIQKIENMKIDIEILQKLPNKKFYDYLLLCNNSIDRYSTFKKIITKNKVNYVLFEKFVFLKKKQYENTMKYIDFKKTIVNVWGGILFKMLKTDNLKETSNEIKVILPEGTMLTNLIHYYHFFSLLGDEKIDVKKKIKRIIKSKRKPYNELLGKIILETKKNSMVLYTSKRIKNFHMLLIKNKKKEVKIKIQIPKILYYPNKILSFPTAKKITKLNFDILEKKIVCSQIIKLPNFKQIKNISEMILKEFSLINKKKILFT